MGLFKNLFGGGKKENNENTKFLNPQFRSEEWYKLTEKGISDLQINRYDSAIEYFNKAIQLNESNYFLWSLKATAYEDSKRYNEAIQAYRESLKLNEWYVTYNQIAICLFYIQDYQDSLIKYNKAI